ncbi:PREDICTED: zinc finger protein 39-like [Ceratosolen solmsi marchali]|uniref:Zinc finger protein 39-like n=1 Tax=Ceratosolen solmsi marchali TaxID=326594 RepID=A0AAJ6YRS9_9HYME|nr:PREDICTED: zinc finger protein 39-like [Ceratosolen solmsi marchali]
MCNEKKELAVNTKEGCNSELVSISIVKHETCKAKNKAQEDIKIDTNDNQTNSSTRLKRKKRKEQNKKNDKQITIRKGKRKRKPKVLFYEDNYETDTKGPSPKRRRRGKDWSHIVTLPGNTVTYKCTFCEKMFKSPRGKWYHTSCPSGEAPFRCHLCARTFAKRSHFEYHERMHSGHKPFACNFCDKSFVQKSKLNRHLLIHKQQNDIECAECGRRFSTKQYLKNHMSIHQNNSYKCKFCPKTFTLAFNRKRHERSHSTDRPYKCDICSKDFKDVKPYSCNQCNLEFRRKDNLNRHVKHHHVLDSDTLKTVENDFKEQADNTERIVNGNANEKLSNQEERSIEEKSSKFKNNIEKPTNNVKTKPKQKRTSRSNSISSTKSILKTSLCSPQPHRQAGSKPDVSNAVPVIRGPISIKRFAEGSEIMGTRLGFTQSIPPEEAVVLNRQIEEKIYTQDSFCIYPGLNRRANSIVRRRDSCGSNSNSNDDTSFACKQNPEKSKTVHFAKEEQCEVLRTDKPKVVKDINLHWRRRTAESLKTKISKSKQT